MTDDPNLPPNAVAIVGMAGRFPGANSPADLWKLVREGREAIRRLSEAELRAAGVAPALLANPHYVRAAATLDRMDGFDAGFFGFSPRDAAIMDPQHRHFLETAWEAIESAGYTPEGFEGSIGVFGGCGMQAYFAQNLLNNPQLMASAGYFLVRHTGNDKDFLATRVSYQLNLKGPSVSVQTACSTSLVAIHLACQSLLNRECDMALAGGVTIEQPHGQGYIYEEGEILSPDGHCRAFDASSKGTVFGSGAGIVVLRRLEDAMDAGDHIHAVIIGSAVNNDGAGKVGYLAPSVDGQAAVVAEAIALAGISPETVTYVETHGTGTPVGDPIEVAALTEAFGRQTTKRGFCGIGSIKTNIGHLDTAAGVASIIKAASAVEHGELPPSLNYETPNPTIPFDDTPFYVNATLRPWTPDGVRRAGVTSLGVGGTNAHVLLEEAPARPAAAPGKSPNVLVLSARSEDAAQAAVDRLADHLRAHPSIDIADAAWTLQTGRRAFDYRRAVVAADAADAVEVMSGAHPKRLVAGRRMAKAPSVVFLFPGGGAQYPNMGREIYEREPVFRDEVDRGLRLLRERHGVDLRPLLFPDPARTGDAARELERSTNSILSIFIVEHALATLWISWGVRPAAMTGHSLGEYTAACIAGVFSFEDALTIVKARGDIFERLPAGAMLSVPMSEADLAPLITGDLALAAVNGPSLCVASGPVEQIDAFDAVLSARGIETRRLHISVAAHSAMLEPHLAEFGERVRSVKLSAPSMPFISNVTGRWADADVARHDYWVRHLRQTVRFSDGLSTLLQDNSRVLIEAGPGVTLGSLARAHVDDDATTRVVASMRHPQDASSDLAVLYAGVAQAWVAGVPIDWAAFEGPGRRRVPLPTYPFEHQRYWIDAVRRPDDHATPRVDGRRDTSGWLQVPVWTRVDDRSAPANAVDTRWLILADDEASVAGLKRTIERFGGRAFTATPGQAFAQEEPAHYTVAPASQHDFERLFSSIALADGDVTHVVLAWTLRGGAIEDGFFSVLALAKTLAALGPARLVAVTRGLQQVDTEPVEAPEQALISGTLGVVDAEVAHVSALAIDLPAGSAALSDPADPLVDAVVVEALADAPQRSVALRASGRWIVDYRPLPPSAAGDTLPLKAGGVYLLTGGLGGIALTLAESIAKTTRVTLALVGRRGLPPRGEWDAWCREHAADEQAATIAHVRRIEALGASVEVPAADITHPAEVRALVDDIVLRHGRIDGVIHAAGLLADNLIVVKSPDEAARVLAPKVQGTIALSDALAGQALDFWVNCSSVSAFVGLPGQIDYAAANAFLDAFARWRNARGFPGTVSVAWQAWRDVGMLRAAGRTSGDEAWTPLDGGLLQSWREGPTETLFRSTFSAKDWVLDEHRLAGGHAIMPGTAFVAMAVSAARRATGSDAVEIDDLVFLAPFAAEAAPVELRVSVENATGEIAMASGPADGPVEHVRGTVRATSASAPDRIDIAAVTARCTDAVSPAAPNLAHLVVGPRWHCTAAVTVGPQEAIARVSLPAEFAGEVDRFAIHPALLDVATACSLWIAADYEPTRDFFVPISYGRVLAWRPMTCDIWCHARRRVDARTSPDVAVLDLTIASADGTVLMAIERFVLRRMAPLASLAVSPTGKRSGGIDLSGAIAAQEGGAAFLDVLRSLPLSQVVVGPETVGAIVEASRRMGAGPASPEPSRARRTPLAAPTDDLERGIAAIWADLLGIAEIGIDDNFFELGGHSLLLAQVGSRMRRALDAQVPVAHLFEYPTIRQTAEFCRRAGHGPDEPALVAVPRDRMRRSKASLGGNG